MKRITLAFAGLLGAGVLAATAGTADASSSATNPCLGGGAVINGTAASETLVGTPGADFITGGGGNDVLIGLGGEDVLVGGPGADDIFGGRCNDDMFGGLGVDSIFGGLGASDDGVGGPPFGADFCDAATENQVGC